MLWLEEHHADSADSTEIAELVDEFSNAPRRSLTEDRFETPLAVVHVVGRSDDRLELVLKSMKIADDERVLAVIVSLVGITLVLVAGYERYEDRLERYSEYLPAITAAILILMGVGFIVGVF